MSGHFTSSSNSHVPSRTPFQLQSPLSLPESRLKTLSPSKSKPSHIKGKRKVEKEARQAAVSGDTGIEEEEEIPKVVRDVGESSNASKSLCVSLVLANSLSRPHLISIEELATVCLQFTCSLIVNYDLTIL